MKGKAWREAASTGPPPVAVLDVGRVRLQHQGTTVGVDEGVALSALDLLAGVIALGPPASVVLTLWLSSTPAEGLAARPLRARSSMTRWWFSRARTQSSRSRRNQP